MPGDLNEVLPGHLDGVLSGHLDGVLPGHLDGVLPGHFDGVFSARAPIWIWGFAKAHGYGRVFPSKTLRNVPAFARAFTQAYARANARAKAKGGGVMGVIWVWHGCDLYVLPRQLPGQNENGLLSWMGFCPGTWMGFRPGT